MKKIAAASALAIAVLLSGCEDIAVEVEKLNVRFVITGPENTTVTITRKLDDSESSKSEVLRRKEPGDRAALYFEDVSINENWRQGAGMVATVTLTANGRESEEAISSIPLNCTATTVADNPEDAVQLVASTGSGSVACVVTRDQVQEQLGK